MTARLTLVAVLAGALLGCDDGAEPPRPGAPEAVSAPGEAEETETLGTAEALLGEDADSGTVALRQGDDAPPEAVPIRATVGSCDARGVEPLCFAFTGAGWTLAAAQAECAGAEGGVFQSAACPTEARIGACVYRPEGDAAREIVYTFYAPMDPLVAEGVCRGTFRAF